MNYRKIYKEIKRSKKIVIARHVGADPDALASQIGLRDTIKNTFPKKEVFAVGCPASRFRYLGNLDKFDEDYDALLIVVDTPDAKRVDGVDPKKFKRSIKIDHHPFVEKICTYEWIDDTASSASQMILECIYHTRLQMTKEVAEKLFLGIVADTNRFLFSYTSSKTFSLVSKLLKNYQIDMSTLYDHLYLRPLKEIKFQAYITLHLTITEHGLAYLKLTDEVLKQYEVDAATAGNMINNFNYIEEAVAWAIFSEDVKNANIRGSIRSRGPIINDVAARFQGGGHIYASGVRLENFEKVDELIDALEERCKEFKQKEN